jgi:hypothetical protein
MQAALSWEEESHYTFSRRKRRAEAVAGVPEKDKEWE